MTIYHQLHRRKMLPSHAPSAAGYNEHHDEEDLEEDMQGMIDCRLFAPPHSDKLFKFLIG